MGWFAINCENGGVLDLSGLYRGRAASAGEWFWWYSGCTGTLVFGTDATGKVVGRYLLVAGVL